MRHYLVRGYVQAEFQRDQHAEFGHDQIFPVQPEHYFRSLEKKTERTPNVTIAGRGGGRVKNVTVRSTSRANGFRENRLLPPPRARPIGSTV